MVFSHISDAPITEGDLNILVKLALTLAIENDLMAPPYPKLNSSPFIRKLKKPRNSALAKRLVFV